ncbi:MAG: DUF3526 domain-containing protein [Bacteroidota bacterium]
MRKKVLLLISRQFFRQTFRSKGVYLLLVVWAMLLFYAAFSGSSYTRHNHFRTDHQEEARKSWEANPDKHPHRMAHFGTFAFRLKHPLSIFEYGIESYTGNAVFLEAHRQNTVNFSEAGFSTGLLRIGELSMAVILQLLLPLLIFFMGYAAISADRENGTLKILLTQGAKWKEVLFGRTIGLFYIGMLLLIPVFIFTATLLLFDDHATTDVWLRFFILLIMYLLFVLILCMITVSVSSASKSSAGSLLKLLGIWLVMIVMLPRTAQAIGGYFYPTPGKMEFKSAIEEEVIQYGDSHDPEDPHFNSLRDSVLTAYKVSTVDELPFNYSGFVMKEGERISAMIYNKHHNELLDRYRKQNQFSSWMAIVNPYMAVKNLSMSLSDTGFESYVYFQKQAEDYRYKLAQHMNNLQIKYIGAGINSSEGKRNVIDRSEWQNFDDFEHRFLRLGKTLANELVSLISLIVWTLLSTWMVGYNAKNTKVV